jgi:hypothetical protein
MQHCLDRLQKLDPSPESAIHDCARTVFPNTASRELRSTTDELWFIRKGLSAKALDLITGYSKLGADIFPKDDNDVSYKHLKMLQLIKLDGPYARDPAPDGGLLKKFRENMEDYTLTALQAATKLSAPALQQRIPGPPKL